MLTRNIFFLPSRSLAGILAKTPRHMPTGVTELNQLACPWSRWSRPDAGSRWWGRTSPPYPRLAPHIIPCKKTTPTQMTRRVVEADSCAFNTSSGVTSCAAIILSWAKVSLQSLNMRKIFSLTQTEMEGAVAFIGVLCVERCCPRVHLRILDSRHVSRVQVATVSYIEYDIYFTSSPHLRINLYTLDLVSIKNSCFFDQLNSYSYS